MYGCNRRVQAFIREHGPTECLNCEQVKPREGGGLHQDEWNCKECYEASRGPKEPREGIMIETFEKWWQENTDLADLPNARLAKAAWSAALASKSSAPAETEMELRRLMWLSHGHHGIYGDDGEMQCAECGRFGCWDYKNAPLDEVRATFYKAKESLMLAASKSSAEGESKPMLIEETISSITVDNVTLAPAPQIGWEPPVDCAAQHPDNPDTYCGRYKGHSDDHAAACTADHPLLGLERITWPREIGWEQARETVRADNAYPQAYAENSPRYGWRIFSCPVSSPYKTVKLGSGSDEPSAWLSAHARMMEEKCEGCGEPSDALKESGDSVLLCPKCTTMNDADAAPKDESGEVELPPLSSYAGSFSKEALDLSNRWGASRTGWELSAERERQFRAALAENKRLREKNVSLLKEIQEKNHAGARKLDQRLRGEG